MNIGTKLWLHPHLRAEEALRPAVDIVDVVRKCLVETMRVDVLASLFVKHPLLVDLIQLQYGCLVRLRHKKKVEKKTAQAQEEALMYLAALISTSTDVL